MEKSPGQITGPSTPPLENLRRAPDESSSTSERMPAVDQKPSKSSSLSLDLSLGRAPAVAATSSHFSPDVQAPVTGHTAGAQHKAAAPRLAPALERMPHVLQDTTGIHDHLSLQLAILFQEDDTVAAASIAAALAVAVKGEASKAELVSTVHRPKPQYPTGELGTAVEERCMRHAMRNNVPLHFSMPKVARYRTRRSILRAPQHASCF